MVCFLINTFKKCYCIVRKYTVAFIFGVIAAIVCFFVIDRISRALSASAYCGSRCHEMKEVYRNWQLSTHVINSNGIVVECIDCHLPPREDYFKHMTAKSILGARDIYKHYFGDEYNAQEVRARIKENMPDELCVYCHSNLLAKPASAGSRIAHRESLASGTARKYNLRCVDCHEMHAGEPNASLPATAE
ncbi:MAG: NapC/NirT family cytochrome c [Planctomycetota bacterium]